MTEAGHNKPPPFDAWSMHIEDLFALVSDSTAGGKVETDEQEAALDGLLDDFRKARKEADAERAAEKKPHDDAAAAIQTKWKPLLTKCDAATAEIKGLLTPYRTARQAAKDEAARKAREEAEAAQKAAQATLQQSEDLEARFAAEEQLKQASKLAAVANKIDRSATGLRTYQIADVTDYPMLLKHVKAHDPDALRAWLDEYARKALPSQLPGVTIRTEKRAA